MVTRFDTYDRVWSDPQPFLFQRHIGQHVEVMTTDGIAEKLRHLCQAIALTDPRFEGVHFRPHDFCRIFATELVNNGLPIHIGAGAVRTLEFGDDPRVRRSVRRGRHQALSSAPTTPPRRSAGRGIPVVTEREWAKFQAHFDKRKVELGICGRPCATPCIHEHACVRCPLLNVDPKMRLRLDELEADLIARRQRADEEGWQGEIEGIELTLGFLRDKRDRVNRSHDLETEPGGAQFSIRLTVE